MMKNFLSLLTILLLAFLLGCESNHSQYKLGKVPDMDDEFYNQYLDEINQAIEKSPNDPELYYKKSVKLLESQKFNSAMRTIEKSLDLLDKKASVKYYQLAAVIYAKNEAYEKALTCLNKVKDKGENTARTDAIAANVFWKKGDFLKADSVSKNAISKDPYNSEYYFIRGNIKWAMYDTLSARENFIKSLRIKPATDTYRALLDVYIANENFDDAFAILNKLIALNPNDLDIQYKKAAIHANINEEDKAKIVYRNIIKQHPKSYEAYYNLSDMYAQMLRYDSAIYFQNQVIVQDSSLSTAYLNLARIYERRFWYSSAIDYFNRYLQLEPDNLVARKELEKLEDKMRYINRLQQERKRLSNVRNLKTIQKEEPNGVQ